MDDSAELHYKLHECDYLPNSGIQVIYDNFFNQELKSWRLYIYREATEEDLEENHYLETTDDLIWTTSVEIKNCPYCGENLYEGIKLHQNIGNFIHHDHSGWNLKVQ